MSGPKIDPVIQDRGKWHFDQGSWYADLWILEMIKKNNLQSEKLKKQEKASG